jgi:hypothetical protein
MDVAALERDGDSLVRCAVLDLKLGYREDEHTGQLLSYACLLRQRHGMPSTGYILGVELWARLGVYAVHKFTEEVLGAHLVALGRQVSRRGSQWGPSDRACLYCPRRLSCPAFDDYVRSAFVGLAPLDGNRFPASREMMARFYDGVKAAERTIARAKGLIRAFAAEAPIDLGNGRRLVIVENELDEIVASKALPILRDEFEFSDDDVDAAVSVTKSGLERVAKQRTAHGKAAAYERRILGRLREADAITKTIRTELRETKGESNG